MLPGNTLYGWNLEATGEGYLAQGNIRWDNNGQLSISGDLNIKGSNGIHIMNDYNYNTFNITGRTSYKLDEWINTN